MTTVRQLSFAAGEIAPALYARVDQTKYATGLRTLRNAFVMRHGGATNRPGSGFIGEVKDSSKTVRLIPFVFSTDQTYVLEFGDLYIRIIHSGAYVSDLSLTITNITQGSPAVLTYTGTDPTNGQEVAISGVIGMTQVNGRNFKIGNVNSVANTLELRNMDGTDLNTTSYTAYSSGGTAARIYTVTTTYAEADLPDLKYIQSADVVTIVHSTYAPRELTRASHSSWTLSTISFAPSIAAPVVATGVSGGTFNKYRVTSIKDETFEESLKSNQGSGGTVAPSPTAVVVLTWTQVSGAREYNVYRTVDNTHGFIGIAGDSASPSFNDIGTVPDTTDTPPDARNPFSSDWPSCIAYIQQRLMFANTPTYPEKVWGSRIGFFKNFTISTPIEADDSVTFTMSGRQVNRVKHLLDLGNLVIFTDTGEWSITGDSNGTITPADINPRQHSYNGSSNVPPIVIGSTALYVQERGSIIRDLAFEFQSDGYRGTDLTIFSAHLVDGYTIEEMTYQKTPHSVVWAVRDDGTLIGLTYVREHELVGWSRHDFDNGIVENAITIPEGNEDSLYLVIKRTINGSTKRYVEKLHTRFIDDIVDSVFLDSSLTYDGRNTGSGTMTISGGTNWDYTETLTITSSTSYFASTDVGKAVFVTGTDGTIIRLTITAYSSATVVSGIPNKTVPVAMRSSATTDWALAVSTVSGLWHLEGEDVSIFGDGTVVANPNNSHYSVITVSSGQAVLDDHYAVIHVGVPITADIETLDIDTAAGETLMDKKNNITKVNVSLQDSRGLWIGAKPPTDDDTDPLEGLYELKIRDTESYDDPVILSTEVAEVKIKSEWNSNGRVFLRQVDPVPLTVLSIAPAGLIPFQRKGGGYG